MVSSWLMCRYRSTCALRFYPNAPLFSDSLRQKTPSLNRFGSRRRKWIRIRSAQLRGFASLNLLRLGQTATMQAVNIEYADAMRRAIPSEENEYRREQANAGFEPLREAIEFAVTLPENVSVIIRGFWL